MTVASTLVRQVRRGGQVSQREFAALTGERQSAISAVETGRNDPGVERVAHLVGAFGYSVTVLPTRRQTVAAAAESIYDALRAGDEARAYRELVQVNDDLAAERGALKVALTVTPPAPVGDRRYDAFLASLVEHHLERERLPVPTWTSDPWRRVETPWIVDEYGDASWAASPASFRRRNIIVSADELASA
jgi:transcriptional regulator with XRE-family HTH domain